jgi:hypothetical protein
MKYIPDFKLRDEFYVETKGRFTHEDRRKMLAVFKHNPGIKLVIVFSHPNHTITKKSKTTYGEWCDKHGIPWIGFKTIVESTEDAYHLLKGRAGMADR